MLQTSKTFYTDVVVCGGGPAGCAAAISAAREGKSVILLEMRESLGGLCTNGYITGIAGNVDGLCLEWVKRLSEEGHAVLRSHLPVVEPEYGKAMLEQMILQSEGRILYGAHVADVNVNNGRIESVIVYCKQGKVEIKGKVYIDCTGDADVVFAAGCPHEIGNAEFMGLNQSVTMGFRLSYVNLNKYYAAVARFKKSKDFDVTDLSRRSYIVFQQNKAIANGDLHEVLSPGNLVYPMPGDPECTDVTLDATHTFDCHNDDIADLSRQIVDQHRKVIWFTQFLNKYVEGFENAVLTNFAPMNGVRDSRRAVGEYIFTEYDIAAAKKFEDGIWQHSEFFDAHVPTPGRHTASRHIHAWNPIEPAVCRPTQDEKNYMMNPYVSPRPWEVRVNPREYCEIPFRSLIVKGVDNLMVAGRCFSSTYHANGSARDIAPSMGMGQAAGIGACMVIDKNLNAVRELDGKLVRQRLIELGVNLEEAPGGFWKTVREFEGEFVVAGNDWIQIINEKGESPKDIF